MLNTCIGTGKYGSATRHDELVHTGAFCPACEAIEKLHEANQTMQEMDSTIEDLNRKIQSLSTEGVT